MHGYRRSLPCCDFFSVDVLGVFGTVRYMVFFVIELKSRAVEIAGIRIDPDGEWMKQIARNLTDPVVSENLSLKFSHESAQMSSLAKRC